MFHAVIDMVLVPVDLQGFLNLINVDQHLTLALGLQDREQRRGFAERLKEEVFCILPSYPRRILSGGAVKVSTKRVFCTRQE